jgi:hypothetical protein
MRVERLDWFSNLQDKRAGMDEKAPRAGAFS